MERTNNYLIQRDLARKHFLNYDQEQIIRKWALKSDDNWIYTEFLGAGYRIRRADALVLRETKAPAGDRQEDVQENDLRKCDVQENDLRKCDARENDLPADMTEAGFEEVLSIFDLLCHTEEKPYPAGTFAPVNSLKGRPAIAVSENIHRQYAAFPDRDPDGYCRACEMLGGRRISLGDIGYEFCVFQDLKLRLKFYHSDDEFPAQLICFWDEHALDYVFYETTFYIAGFLFKAVIGNMPQDHEMSVS